MLSIGMTEIVVLMVVILLVVRPDQLPGLIRDLGRFYGKMRRMSDELRRAFVLEADRQDANDRYSELREKRRQAKKDQSPPTPERADVVSQSKSIPKAPVSEEEEDDDRPGANDIAPDAPHPRTPKTTP